MRQLTLYFMLLAVSVTFVMGSPPQDGRALEARTGGDKGKTTSDKKPTGTGNKKTTDTGSKDNAKDKCRRGKISKKGRALLARAAKTKGAGTLCGTKETKTRPTTCKPFKSDAKGDDTDAEEDDTVEEKREAAAEDEATTSKYTPKSKKAGKKQVARLDGELTALSEAAGDVKKICDHIVPIQVFDLTMWENQFCSILDSLVAIVEPKGKEQSAWKLELMSGPVEIATGKKNMLKIETQMYQDKLKLTSSVITGKEEEEEEEDGAAEEDDEEDSSTAAKRAEEEEEEDETDGSGEEGEETADEGLLAYLENTKSGVTTTAKNFGEAIKKTLQKAKEEAHKCATAKQKKKIVTLETKMKNVPENIEAGIKKYHQDIMTAAENMSGDGEEDTTEDEEEEDTSEKEDTEEEVDEDEEGKKSEKKE